MKLRYTALSALFVSAVLLLSCGGSKGGGVLPIGPDDNNDDPAPSAGYLGGAVVQNSKLQLPGAGIGAPDEKTEVGETVACMNDVGELTHLEIYEYYEARELSPVNISLGASSDDPWARVADTLSKINHLNPELVKDLIEVSHALKGTMRLLPSAKLLSYPMKNSVITLPANCFLLQAAMMNIDSTGYQYSFLVDKTIWDAMNSDQKTGLILHETLKMYYNLKFLVTDDTDGSSDVSSPYPDHSGINRNFTMNHRSFRQTHINYVDTNGFRTLGFTDYLSTISQLGQSSIKIGEHVYHPGQIEFYNVEERKVKRGYLSQSATLPSPSPLFKELTVHGEVSFYEDGKIKEATVGNTSTSTTNGVPDQMHLYQQWELTRGGNGHLSGTAVFGEDGQFLGINFGFLYQAIPIKLPLYDLTVDANTSDTAGGRIFINEVQSFNFLTNSYCRSCTGALTPISTLNPRITFKNASIRYMGLSGHEISNSTEPFSFALADGSKIRSRGSLIIDTNGNVTSIDALDGFSITCADGNPVRQMGRIKFNTKGKIESINDQPLECTDYKFVPFAI